jgi:uncharacterized protein YbjT (DUF2867 family)
MSEGKKTVGVIGSTGIQGGSVVNALLANGKYNVVAFTRNTEKEVAKDLSKRGCEVRYLDMDQPNIIEKALLGCQCLFLVTNFWEHFNPEREYEQATCVANIAQKVGIQHVVWSTLEDTRTLSDNIPFLGNYKVAHFDEKGHASRYMESIGLKVTHLYTSFYWENLIHLIKPQKGEDGVYRMVYPMGNKLLPGVAVADIGRAVNTIIERGPDLDCCGISSETISVAEMANVLSDVSGCQVTYVDMDPEEYRQLEFPGAKELGNMFQYKRDHNQEFCNRRDVKWLSKEWTPCSFYEWAQRNYKQVLDL